MKHHLLWGIFDIQFSSVMAVNSHHFACSCINQQTESSQCFQTHRCMTESPRPVQFLSPFSPTDNISSCLQPRLHFPPPTHWNFSKMPKGKKKDWVHFTRKVISRYCIWNKTCLYFELVCRAHCSRAGSAEEQSRKAKGLRLPSLRPAGARHGINSVQGLSYSLVCLYSIW